MQKTDEILNKSPGLHQILARIKHQRLLQEQFITLIGSPFKDKCQVSRFQDGILYLVTSATWASRVYYEAPRIIAELKVAPIFKDIQGIRCSVAPIASLEQDWVASSIQLTSQKSPPSAEVIESLMQCAESIQDPDLKKTFKRLASRFEK